MQTIFSILGLFLIGGALAKPAPTLVARESGTPVELAPRQIGTLPPDGPPNDVAECEDGKGDALNKSWEGNTAANCYRECFLTENADNGNKNNICAGRCVNAGFPAAILRCRGK